MDAARRRRNRARAERRRRAHKRLMAAKIEAATKLQIRGGKKKWKAAMKRRYNRDIQKKKQQRRRHRERNRQIWMRLQAIVAKAETAESTLMQLINEEDKTRIHPLVKI